MNHTSGMADFFDGVLPFLIPKSKTETLEEAFTPSLYSSGDTVITDWNSMYGFGWDIIYDKKYGRMVNHGGGQVGYRSKIIRYLDHKVTVNFLSNMENDNFWIYTGDIAKMYLDLSQTRKRIN